MSLGAQAPGDARKDETAWFQSPPKAHSGAREVGWQALGPAIACTVLATVVVALRWYTRCKLTSCLGTDDWVILFSMVLAWCMCAIIGAELNEGLGVYEGGRTVDTSHLAKLVIINNNLWSLAVNITKASILAQYLRIFSGRTTRLLCYILLLSLIPAMCWSIFDGTFLCRPVAKLWKPQLQGHCMNAQTYWLSAAGINIGLDFLVLLLPLPSITSLRLPPRQRICLVLVFVLGFFVCVVSIVRVVTVHIMAQEGDFVGSGIQAVTWSAVEANIGIICASLLALKPLILKFWPTLLKENTVLQHSLRLPMMPASSLDRGRTYDDIMSGEDSQLSLSQLSPTRPTSARSKGSGFMSPWHSTAATLPGAPQSEELSFVDMIIAGPELESARYHQGSR